LTICNFGYTGSEKNNHRIKSNLFLGEDRKSHISNCNDLNYWLNKELISNRSEGCVNITGNWAGKVVESGYEITLKLLQEDCSVSGELQSLESCPGQCGILNGLINGTVSENNFSFTIPNDPWVDCETCELICFGTDYGDAIVDGNKMHGTIETEDCESGEFYKITINLTRVGPVKGSISGDVIDTEGNPIESAKVNLKGINTKILKKRTSSEDGLFEFKGLDADTYIIKVRKKGYKKSKQTIELQEGEDVDIEIELEK